jgi:cytosine/adenosine deaminase-related metal-dependent hydrolase
LLIKNGHLAGLGVQDVLIKDGIIAAIGSAEDGTENGTEVLDADGLVVIPGFVDTHRHLVQSALRGLGGDMTLDYFLSEVVTRMAFSPEEAGQSILLGAAEALNAGITTILDWSIAPLPAEVSVEALTQAGIRAVFGHGNVGDEADVRRYADRTGLVTTAMATPGVDYASIEDTIRHITLARDLGLVSSIHVGGQKPGGVAALRDLLGPDLHFVHGNRNTDDEIKMIVGSGATLTVATIVESMMGHGKPAYSRIVQAGGKPALGIDAIVSTRPDMFGEMRATLWHERVNDAKISTADVFEAATKTGAEALKLNTGELKAGKRADLVLLDGLQHLLGTSAVEGGIVTTLGPENVRTVLVDGRIVKQDGVLRDHDLETLRAQTRHLAARVLGQ